MSGFWRIVFDMVKKAAKVGFYTWCFVFPLLLIWYCGILPFETAFRRSMAFSGLVAVEAFLLSYMYFMLTSENVRIPVGEKAEIPLLVKGKATDLKISVEAPKELLVQVSPDHIPVVLDKTTVKLLVFALKPGKYKIKVIGRHKVKDRVKEAKKTVIVRAVEPSPTGVKN